MVSTILIITPPIVMMKLFLAAVRNVSWPSNCLYASNDQLKGERNRLYPLAVCTFRGVTDTMMTYHNGIKTTTRISTRKIFIGISASQYPCFLFSGAMLGPALLSISLSTIKNLPAHLPTFTGLV